MQIADDVVDAIAEAGPTEPKEETSAEPLSPPPDVEPKPPEHPRKKWNPILTALGGLYLVSAASHLIARPDHVDWWMITLVVLTGVTLVALRWLFNLSNLSA